MNMCVRRATPADLAAVAQLYDDLNDYLAAHVNYPGWKKGIYPTGEDAQEGLEAGELYVAQRGGEIVGAVICLHGQETAYRNIAWGVVYDVPVMVLHTVAVHPRAFGSGIGEALMAYAQRLARDEGLRAIRLDVYEKNLPAVWLYERSGFVFCGLIDLGLEKTTGLKWFRAYEKVL